MHAERLAEKDSVKKELRVVDGVGDNLDYKRTLEFLADEHWQPIRDVERSKDLPDGEQKKEELSGTNTLTMVEFLTLKGGAITGLFFDPDGVFKWSQRYFLDRTKLE